ncbi:MAG: hypothetical protein GC162_19045 [Planctomycetes bacterium]|nr:hypothetical protein [Planctomycetota bacterium]
MPTFEFTARSANGAPHRGLQEAGSTAELIAELRSRGWIVLGVQMTRDTVSKVDGLRRTFSLRPNPSRFELEIALQQLSTMLRSGLPLLTALGAIAEHAPRRPLAYFWRGVRERIEQGATLADALTAQYPRIAPVITHLVRVGEATGTLDIVLERAAEHLEGSRQLRTTLLSALAYPSFVLVAALVVAGFMVFSVIPKLQKFIAGYGRRLPAISQALLDVSGWLQVHGTAVAVALLVFVLLCVIGFRLRRVRDRTDRVALRLPILGQVLRVADTAAVASSMNLLVRSGLTVVDALKIVQPLVVSHAAQARLGRARAAVIQGGSLAGALTGGREFTPMLASLVTIGELAGNLDGVLAEVARFHKLQLAAIVRRFSTWFEPLVVLVVGGVVGFVYIAFFAALFSIAGGAR